jgi:DNA-binding NarL/FixJ family response regulator
MINILLVDDHKVVRDGLKFYFEDHDDYHITAEAENGVDALSKLDSQQFDLIITDISMPEMDGMALMKEIRERLPEQPVIALTMLGESQHIKQMLALGVNGYLLKNSGEDEIINAIGKVISGDTYYSQEVTQILINDLSGKKIKPKTRLTLETPLSDREKEVLKLIVQEYSNQEIADKLFISVRTVDAHKRNMLEKTGAKNIAGLVMYAVEHDLAQ